MKKTIRRILLTLSLLVMGSVITAAAEKKELMDSMIELDTEISKKEMDDILENGTNMTAEFERFAAEHNRVKKEELNELFLKYMNTSLEVSSSMGSCGYWRFYDWICRSSCNSNSVIFVNRRWCGPPSSGSYEYFYTCTTWRCIDL